MTNNQDIKKYVALFNDTPTPKVSPNFNNPVKDDEGRSFLRENWDKKMHTAKKDKGMWDGWTLAELKAELSKLKNKPNKTTAVKKREHQVEFAIRAKQKNKWGKIKEGVTPYGKQKACPKCKEWPSKCVCKKAEKSEIKESVFGLGLDVPKFWEALCNKPLEQLRSADRGCATYFLHHWFAKYHSFPDINKPLPTEFTDAYARFAPKYRSNPDNYKVGNKNALSEGFFSRKKKAVERTALDDMHEFDSMWIKKHGLPPITASDPNPSLYSPEHVKAYQEYINSDPEKKKRSDEHLDFLIRNGLVRPRSDVKESRKPGPYSKSGSLDREVASLEQRLNESRKQDRIKGKRK